jgi:hypothetical protein
MNNTDNNIEKLGLWKNITTLGEAIHTLQDKDLNNQNNVVQAGRIILNEYLKLKGKS